MSRGRCLASRQPQGSKSAASASHRRFDASPRSGLGLVVIASALLRSRLLCLASTRGIGTSKLCYDIIIYNFHPSIFFKSVFQLHEAGAVMVVLKINIVVSCHTVLRVWQVKIIYMVFWLPCLGLEHSASASPVPRTTCLCLCLALPRLDLIFSCLASPRPRQFSLGLAFMKTASPTSLSSSDIKKCVQSVRSKCE